MRKDVGLKAQQVWKQEKHGASSHLTKYSRCEASWNVKKIYIDREMLATIANHIHFQHLLCYLATSSLRTCWQPETRYYQLQEAFPCFSFFCLLLAISILFLLNLSSAVTSHSLSHFFHCRRGKPLLVLFLAFLKYINTHTHTEGGREGEIICVSKRWPPGE
jgi:hypothetical protein